MLPMTMVKYVMGCHQNSMTRMQVDSNKLVCGFNPFYLDLVGNSIHFKALSLNIFDK